MTSRADIWGPHRIYFLVALILIAAERYTPPTKPPSISSIQSSRTTSECYYPLIIYLNQKIYFILFRDKVSTPAGITLLPPHPDMTTNITTTTPTIAKSPPTSTPYRENPEEEYIDYSEEEVEENLNYGEEEEDL